MNGTRTEETWITVSFLTLRRVVGTLGILLPFVLVGGTWLFTFQLDFRESISAYHDSVMGPALAGTLFVVGWFLFTYRGYDRRDDRAGDRACLFAMGVAMFPHESVVHWWVPWVHYLSATSLFLVLAYISYSLFTQTDPDKTPTDEKLVRNRIYRACGLVIVGCVVSIGLYHLLDLDQTGLARLRPVTVLEAVALWSFGLSWFVKGETLWRDRPH